MNLKRFLTLASVAALTLTPAVARADTYLSPMVGISFGLDADDAVAGYGGIITILGRGYGLEVEALFTPDFYDGVNVTTISGNYIAGGDARAGGTKPFGSVGVTLLRTGAEGFDGENKLALNLAGGIVSLFTDNVGLRAELRYFRRIAGESDIPFVPVADNYDFFRAGFGLVLRF